MTKSEYQHYANLLIKAREGNTAAFRKLYESTVAVQHYQLHLCLDREEDIQDALQEVYLLLYQNMHRINPPRVFLAYLNRLTFYVGKNFAKLQTRKKHYVSAIDVTENWTYTEDQNPLFQMIKDDKIRLIREAVDALPEQERSVIFMRYYQKMKLKEVAFSMNISLATVKRLQQSAQKHLKLSLEKQGVMAWGFIIAQSFGVPDVKHSPFTRIKEQLSSVASGSAAKTGLAAIGMTGIVCAGAMAGKSPDLSSANVDLNNSLSCAFIQIAATSPLPIKEVLVRGEDGSALPVSKNSDGSYTADAEYNGDYSIILESTNGKTAHAGVTVSGLDETGPEVLSIVTVSGGLKVTFQDEGSGMDYETVCYKSPGGSKTRPKKVNEEENYALFSLPSQPSTLYYQDKAGNQSETPIQH